jgi:hypothetical protein
VLGRQLLVDRVEMKTKTTRERLATRRPGVSESRGTWSWLAPPDSQT